MIVMSNVQCVLSGSKSSGFTTHCARMGSPKSDSLPLNRCVRASRSKATQAAAGTSYSRLDFRAFHNKYSIFYDVRSTLIELQQWLQVVLQLVELDMDIYLLSYLGRPGCRGNICMGQGQVIKSGVWSSSA